MPGKVFKIGTFNDWVGLFEEWRREIGVDTNDVRKAHAVARGLKAGTVWINAYNLYDVALPFGGYKQSGFGRELGAHAIEHYTELKTVWLNL